MKSYVFRIVVEQDDDRWVAYSPLLQDKGAATWGHTREQALDNIREVLQMPVASMQEYGEHVPDEPATDVRVFTEPQVAVAVWRSLTMSGA